MAFNRQSEQSEPPAWSAEDFHIRLIRPYFCRWNAYCGPCCEAASIILQDNVQVNRLGKRSVIKLSSWQSYCAVFVQVTPFQFTCAPRVEISFLWSYWSWTLAGTRVDKALRSSWPGVIYVPIQWQLFWSHREKYVSRGPVKIWDNQSWPPF